jgi:hypothetical protein
MSNYNVEVSYSTKNALYDVFNFKDKRRMQAVVQKMDDRVNQIFPHERGIKKSVGVAAAIMTTAAIAKRTLPAVESPEVPRNQTRTDEALRDELKERGNIKIPVSNLNAPLASILENKTPAQEEDPEVIDLDSSNKYDDPDEVKKQAKYRERAEEMRKQTDKLLHSVSRKGQEERQKQKLVKYKKDTKEGEERAKTWEREYEERAKTRGREYEKLCADNQQECIEHLVENYEEKYSRVIDIESGDAQIDEMIKLDPRFNQYGIGFKAVRDFANSSGSTDDGGNRALVNTQFILPKKPEEQAQSVKKKAEETVAQEAEEQVQATAMKEVKAPAPPERVDVSSIAEINNMSDEQLQELYDKIRRPDDPYLPPQRPAVPKNPMNLKNLAKVAALGALSLGAPGMSGSQRNLAPVGNNPLALQTTTTPSDAVQPMAGQQLVTIGSPVYGSGYGGRTADLQLLNPVGNMVELDNPMGKPTAPTQRNVDSAMQSPVQLTGNFLLPSNLSWENAADPVQSPEEDKPIQLQLDTQSVEPDTGVDSGVIEVDTDEDVGDPEDDSEDWGDALSGGNEDDDDEYPDEYLSTDRYPLSKIVRHVRVQGGKRSKVKSFLDDTETYFNADFRRQMYPEYYYQQWKKFETFMMKKRTADTLIVDRLQAWLETV